MTLDTYFSITSFTFEVLVLIFKWFINFFKTKELKCVKGQLALITGGANGIGRDIGLKLASLGCNVAVVDIDLENATKTVEEIRSFGVRAESYISNIGKLEDVEKLQVAVENDLGPVDILVNNAGVHFVRSVIDEKPEKLMQMIETNLVSNIWTVRVFLPGMIERKRGHIVAMCSTAGLSGLPEGILYSATKFGMKGFMESLALQFHYDGVSDVIKTTTIFPYFVNTRPFIANIINKGLKHKKVFSTNECGRISVEGILREDEIVTLPKSTYYLHYLICLPLSLKKLILDLVMKKGFRAEDADENGNK